ncbi:MAG: iron chelate uptake ABC transporter family permease subunit [Propionibacteriaceae bacterium]|nr:iron chelate uptake ABC transporter family permease subunit [Propionibacteriaceae bacterium]
MSRRGAVGASIAAAALILGLLGLGWGDYPLSPAQVFEAIWSDASFAHTVVLEWRAPRVVAALACGAALGISGMIFQTITANPLGSPDIIGFATGSYSGALLATTFFGAGGAVITGGALGGGLATAGVVYGLTHRYGAQAFRLIIVGLGVTAMLHALNLWLLTRMHQELALAAAIWAGGSLNLVGWGDLGWGLPLLALAALGSVHLLPLLRQLELGDDLAAAHGVRPNRARMAAIGLGVALVAVVTAAAGPIAFIALTAPQIAARLTGGPGLPLGSSAATGALLLLSADLVAQFIAPQPLPLSVVTVCLGGIYLMGLLVRESRWSMSGGQYE